MPAPSSLGNAFIVVSLVFQVLALGAIGLRVKARKIKSQSLASEDVVIVLAWILALAHTVNGVIGAFHAGFGQPSTSVTFNTLVIMGKVAFAQQFLFIGTVTAVKISIVLFYRHIFRIQAFYILSNIMLAVLSSWFVGCFFATLFQSWPISQNWGADGRYLVDTYMLYLMVGVTDLVLDFFIFLMPIVPISKLRLHMSKKVAIVSILGLGFVCIIASVVRVYWLHQMMIFDASGEGAFNVQFVNMMIWSSVETCLAIICACLPFYGPLFRNGRSAVSMAQNAPSVFSAHGRSVVSAWSEKRKSALRKSSFPSTVFSAERNTTEVPRLTASDDRKQIQVQSDIT